MCSIVVLGAGGYLGFGIAVALRANGHRVYGVVRNDSTAKVLAAHEIIPVIGDVSNPASILSQPFFPSLTHMIDSATAGYPVLSQFVDATAEAAAKTPHRKLSYIYTSGVLVYGKQPDDAFVTETDPIVPFAPNAASQSARKALEDKVLHNAAFRGTVVRPGWVYGGSGGHYLDHLWQYDHSTGNYSISGSPFKRWSWIHISDLSSAYVHLVNASPSLIGGEIFNVADNTQATWAEIKRAAICAAISVDNNVDIHQEPSKKLKIGELLVKEVGSDGFSQAAELSLVISAQKLQRCFGWLPKFNFLHGTEIYYSAWKAAQQQKCLTTTAPNSSAPAEKTAH